MVALQHGGTHTSARTKTSRDGVDFPRVGGPSTDTLLEGYPWLEREDVLACLAYAHRLISHERIEPKVGGVMRHALAA
ncbi:MAG: DUF433 domain-containing protein [Gammaproteobacteria bacterium]|nr:DUF433 domain-containing protein [Gammaproteobacteria bacterium]